METPVGRRPLGPVDSDGNETRGEMVFVSRYFDVIFPARVDYRRVRRIFRYIELDPHCDLIMYERPVLRSR